MLKSTLAFNSTLTQQCPRKSNDHLQGKYASPIWRERLTRLQILKIEIYAVELQVTNWDQLLGSERRPAKIVPFHESGMYPSIHGLQHFSIDESCQTAQRYVHYIQRVRPQQHNEVIPSKQQQQHVPHALKKAWCNPKSHDKLLPPPYTYQTWE